MSARSSAKSRVAGALGSDEHPQRRGARRCRRSSNAGRACRRPRSRPTSTGSASTNPDATPAEIVSKLEKHYLAAVMASGAAVGSAAAFPGIGTLVALSAVAGETVVFLEATAVFVLAVAEVYGIPADHRERRRALVLAVLVGEDSKHARGRPDRAGPHQRRLVVRRRGIAAAARGVPAQLAAAEVLRQALHPQARRDRVRQDAAGRHRRRRRRRRQPADGQQDHRQRPRRRSAIHRRAGRSTLHVLPAPQRPQPCHCASSSDDHNDHKPVAVVCTDVASDSL